MKLKNPVKYESINMLPKYAATFQKVTVTFTEDNDVIQYPFFGVPIGRTLGDKYKSQISYDKEKPLEEQIFYRLLHEENVKLYSRIGRVVKGEEAVDVIFYYLPYKNPEHPMFQPSVFVPIDNAMNTKTEYVLELVFAEDEDLVCPVYVTISSDTPHITRPADIFLHAFCEPGVFLRDDDTIRLSYTGPSTDSSVEVEYDSLCELRNHLVSMRIIDYHCYDRETGEEYK